MNSARKFCIIGTPVGHSKSPELYRKIFDERGHTDYSYVINEIKTVEEFDVFIEDMRRGAWDGCNVTMPWKTKAAETVDVLYDNAAVTGSVNTVVRRDGRLYGDSTDGGGMCDAIVTDCGTELAGKTVVMLGCGGAARSIIAELAIRDAGKILIFGRPGRNMDLTAEIMDRIITRHRSDSDNIGPEGKSGNIGKSICTDKTVITICDQSDIESLGRSVCEADILINCTPVGMAPDTDKLPIPEDIVLPAGLIVADAIYNPDETLLIKKAKSSGCRTVKGIRMLEMQAVRASVYYLE